ncbi:MAG: hypothetical protein KTR31_07025 [Myxococcales bacterium]|nr:hypothetical protein [Myxococcales bacterium]
MAEPVSGVLAVGHAGEESSSRVLVPQPWPHRVPLVWTGSPGDELPLLTAARWSHALVVGHVDDPLLVRVLRRISAQGTSVSVLLGGEPQQVHPGHAHATHAVVADLVRRDAVQGVWTHPRPGEVLELVLEIASAHPAHRVPSADRVDLGPLLSLRQTWCKPAAPVHFREIVGVRLGRAEMLPWVAAWVCVHDVVGALVAMHSAPPSSDPGPPTPLPAHRTVAAVGERLRRALGALVLQGGDPLVDQIAELIQPILDEVQAMRTTCSQVERSRMARLGLFDAVGITGTVRRLRRLQAAVAAETGARSAGILAHLVAGTSESDGSAGSVPFTAWRQAFAGLASDGRALAAARDPVVLTALTEQVAVFRRDFPAAVQRHLEVVWGRAHDPDAAPDPALVASLVSRADAVEVALRSTLDRWAEHARRLADDVLGEDRLVQWVAGDAQTLVALLRQGIAADAVHGARDRALSALKEIRGPEDVDEAVAELRQVADELARAFVHDDLLEGLVRGCDATGLRDALVGGGDAVVLRVAQPLSQPLVAWLRAGGIEVRVASTQFTAAEQLSDALAWVQRQAAHAPSRAGHRNRSAATEHQLADLALPDAAGQSADDLAAVVLAAECLLAGLVLGLVQARSASSEASHTPEHGVWELQGLEVGWRGAVLLPHDGIHLLATEPSVRSRLEQRVSTAIDGLCRHPEGPRMAERLVELAALGPGPRLAAEIGLDAPVYVQLQRPLQDRLKTLADRAVASLVDCTHSSRLRRISRAPTRWRSDSLADLCEAS